MNDLRVSGGASWFARSGRPWALAITLGLVAGSLHAQSTTGALSGEAPRGTTISIESDTGFTREVPVDERGRYQIVQLPLGTYTVTLKRAGQVVDARQGVVLTVNSNTDVSFLAQVETVTVTATRVPTLLDVSTVDSRTVVTSDMLEMLPLGYSSEAIALLAPGVVDNSAGFVSPTGQSVVSFGGASAAENAYYINGFNTTDPLNGLGGLTLPYDAIDQQEIFTGGFSAKYGRSAGGVINAIGKRGTNAWTVGTQLLWEPSATRASERDVYYPATGDLYHPASSNEGSVTTASIGAGGPILRDRLFFYGAYEIESLNGDTVFSVEDTNSFTTYEYDRPRWYAKLDWNITDRHLLELTGASSRNKTKGGLYSFDYEARQRGDFVAHADETEVGGELWSAKYTGYLTDKLTVSALYGESRTKDFLRTPNYNPDLIYLDGLSFQNPALTGGEPIRNAQTAANVVDPERGNRTDNLRLELYYVLGRHNLTVGIDNQTARALKRGETSSGPGFNWRYGQTDPNEPISTGLGVPATGDFPNGEDGYFVVRYMLDYVTSVESKQTAQYIEDNWQIADSLLLSLGLRLDQFENYNGNGDAYIKQTSGQWAPRLGFSWDVTHDARFKVFGNAGRYYLALPLNPAFSAAGAVLNTDTYFTYGGIDTNGYPTGLTQMAPTVSELNQFGNFPDARTVASVGIEPSYQDEFIVGFSKTLGEHWIWGAKATYRSLKRAIDDFCDVGVVFDKAAQLGYDVTFESNPVSCWLFNPGRSNTFTMLDASGNYVAVPITKEEFGFPEAKRNYYALNLALERRYDSGWFGKLDYTFSRSYGTTEGQVLSTIQQGGAAVTIDWDNKYVMEHTNGPQNNDHTHQLKLYGAYQLTQQLLVSANLSVISGAPKMALGSYGDPENTDPSGYGVFYHFYQGQPAPPGSLGRLPWLKQLDLGLTYRPAFAAGLRLNLDVFNVFNSQAPVYRFPYSEYEPGISNPLYGAITISQAPRSVRFGLGYEF
jgi:outer membrane receptor protein involved in Fe transport